jgi:hypothetical protein
VADHPGQHEMSGNMHGIWLGPQEKRLSGMSIAAVMQVPT